MGCWYENVFKLSGSHDQVASRPIYGKKPSNITFLGTKMPITLKLGVQHQVPKYYQICSKDETGLTVTIFMSCSNLFPNASISYAMS